MRRRFDVPVLTQDGKSVRFHSDLVKGNVVAVNFIFTNCKTLCPMLGGMFPNLQKEGFTPSGPRPLPTPPAAMSSPSTSTAARSSPSAAGSAAE
jgi:hypothetical protein